MPVEIILLKNVPDLGERGEIVHVKPGYLRNYLIPKKYAASINSREAEEIFEEIKKRKVEKTEKLELKKDKKIELEKKRKESQIRKANFLTKSKVKVV